MIGATAWDMTISSKPAAAARAAARCSCAGLRTACRNAIATARRPRRRASASASTSAGSSSGSSTCPAESMRSRASIARAYSMGGSRIARAKMSGRCCCPIRSTSRKPRVVTSSVGSPLRSSNALVATVVPRRTDSTCTSPGALRRTTSPMPRMAGSPGWDGSRDSTLWVWSRPSGSRATMSVKVPPRSMANRQPRLGGGRVMGSLSHGP